MLKHKMVNLSKLYRLTKMKNGQSVKLWQIDQNAKWSVCQSLTGWPKRKMVNLSKFDRLTISHVGQGISESAPFWQTGAVWQKSSISAELLLCVKNIYFDTIVDFCQKCALRSLFTVVYLYGLADRRGFKRATNTTSRIWRIRVTTWRE